MPDAVHDDAGDRDPRLKLARDGAVATLTIDRPAARGAFDLAMWAAFPELVADAMADPSVRVLVVTGVTGQFCAGGDIAEFAARADDPAWRAANAAAIRATQLALVGAVKPVVAAVDGDCIGGGCGLALACDLRLASARARFGVTPARLGLLYPLHDTRLLVDAVGPSQARRLLFMGGLVDAAEAARIGLVDVLADGLGAALAGLTDAIVAGSAATQLHAKRTVRRILDGALDDGAEDVEAFEAAFGSEEFRARVAGFLGR